jgi:4'-phosphopantetheinyl transferase
MMRLSPCPAADEVHVWRLAVGALADAEVAARAVAALDDADRQRYARYREDRDRLMFLGGRVMARAVVAGALAVRPDEWQWREGPHGRPEIGAPDTPVRFNLAHSGGVVICAVARGREVGVDVEDRGRRPVDKRVIHRYCAPEEAADVEAQGAAWHDRFLMYWTLKESYLKALGLGISVPLEEIRFTIGPEIRVSFRGSLAASSTDWAFSLLHQAPHHYAAVAASGRAPRVIERTFEP